MLCILGLFLLSSLSTILLAVVCLYGFWIAIKRSPTPHTRRLMVSAALDVNLIVYALPVVLVFLYHTVRFVGTFLFSLYRWINLIPEPSKDYWAFALSHKIFMPGINFLTFSLLAGVVLYVVCRWQKLLYEEMTDGRQQTTDSRLQKLERIISQASCRLPTAVCRLRDYFRTDTGLRFKRNLSIPLVLLTLAAYIAWETWFIYSIYSGFSFSFLQLFFFFGSIAWFFALYIAIQATFFKLVTRGITMAESNVVDFGDWTAEDVSPEKRHQFIKSSLFLLAMVPLLLHVLIVGVECVRAMRIFWGWEVLDCYTMSVSSGTLLGTIYIGTVLSVLAAFWGTIRPQLRNRIYSLLFFGVGVWVFATVEWTPLRYYEPVWDFLNWWLEKGSLDFQVTDPSRINFFYYHLFAGTCLAVYTVLAAWFGLRRKF